MRSSTVLSNVYLFILLCLCVVRVNSDNRRYRSCQDVLTTFGKHAANGQYIINLKNNVGVNIYCTGFTDNQPASYITLQMGRSNNFATVYDKVGDTASCADKNPQEIYNNSGTSEFFKIRVNLVTMEINTQDFKYSDQRGRNKIRYGHAGDKHGSSSACDAMGTFKIDLRGTPFSVPTNVKWPWTGSYRRGAVTKGKSVLKNSTYLGCYVDRTDRVLPSFHDMGSSATNNRCISLCRGLGFSYAGTQFYTQCFCGDQRPSPYIRPDLECSAPCRGNSKEMCGGSWRLSVYQTGHQDTVQMITGRCGGYPGYCYPALSTDLTVDKLVVEIIPSHPCLQPLSPCENEGLCIAISFSRYSCRCYPGYSGDRCERSREAVITDGSQCPAGMVPEECVCTSQCAGAKFEGDICTTLKGNAKMTCRTGDPRHVVMFNVAGSGTVSCPAGSNITGCSYWDPSRVEHFTGKHTTPPPAALRNQVHLHGEADQIRVSAGTCSLLHGCQSCTLQARCKKYMCGCEHGGHCHMVTGECICVDGYYGNKCENFDYCGFYENKYNVSACGDGGVCTAIAEQEIKAFGGDEAGDTCVFPFQYGGNTYGQCAETNDVGPPFACGSKFDGSRDGYIDLGSWSPGRRFTIAAWIRPDVADRTRRTIVGGVGDCRDFGLYHFENFWAYYTPSSHGSSFCTKGLSYSEPIRPGHWYLLAAVQNDTHMTLHVNGHSTAIKTDPNFLPTSEGLWIGGEECCTGRFKGIIKTVKIWKRPLSLAEITNSMNTRGNSLSTNEALTGGLVGHWELGESFPAPCAGVDHAGEDWTISTDQLVSGVHCNISRFNIPKLVTVTVTPWNGSTGGTLQIQAKIDGEINADGSGYRGGASPAAGGSGHQGESYPGVGTITRQDNRGGGGGGVGGAARGDGAGQPGGGAGYATNGKAVVKLRGDLSGVGVVGKVYGSPSLKPNYMGSGGGSGGSAKDLSSSPKGGRGGSGGGSILLMAEQNVVITGYVSATGEGGQGDSSYDQRCTMCPSACNVNSRLNCHGNSTSACWDMSGPGGGGSGGSVFISGQLVDIGRNNIEVSGGPGGYGTLQGCGGWGSVGRVRIEAVVIRGALASHLASLSKANLQDEYSDHSQAGQNRINYKNTTYGNEVYRGCFNDTDVGYRTLAITVSLTSIEQSRMTPSYCMQLCRQKGYKYSGTEYSHQCFCDNHLKMTLKRPDRECGSQCNGNNRLMCGGTYRVSVYGPPPGTPALAHGGAISVCQPWCVTADTRTDNPKWGLCSVGSQYTSSLQIHCACPAGFTGVGCMQTCQEGTWGEGCERNCSCNMNNTAICQSQTGLCQCKPGFSGIHCNATCPDGTFGTNCLGRCNCSAETAECDKVTGKCICSRGWYGNNCRFPCPPGKYGRNCSEKCQCFHGTCEPQYGQCDCRPGYKLPFCSQECDPGNYGPNCEFICNCNAQDCDHVTGACQCNAGYTGQHCEQPCPLATYGKGCSKSCNCFDSFNCDHVTGACICEPGAIGPNCDVPCPKGTYGLNCQRACICKMNQTSRCDPSNGLCSCKTGYMGSDCSQKCPLGFFGENCGSTCDCQHGASCDFNTGSCICPPGWKGSQCETACPEFSYGVNCSGTCACMSAGFCRRDNGECDQCSPIKGCDCPQGYFGGQCALTCGCIHGHCLSNGSCDCSAGWQGDYCDTPCPSGKFGKDCQHNCTCVHGKCHKEIGNCICDSGYYGTNCDKTCVNNTYGADCRRHCLDCGRYSSGSCDIKTGMCNCMAGYQGMQCNKPCNEGKFGQNCSQTCNCQNGARCRNTDGLCYCKDGFTGSQCQTPCAIGRWGLNCSNECEGCGPHSVGCDPSTGQCKCKSGFTGVKCRESCDRGTYGQDCNQQCRCDRANYETCSPLDGTCQCKPGYIGQYCDQVCLAGKWGRGCQQICECRNHGDCDPFDGQCDCQAGFNGTHCENSCPPKRFYGKNCAYTCNCNGGSCEQVYGTCICQPGKKGARCDQDCESTHYGFQCAQLCNCKNQGICNPVDGSCKCQPGWSGQFCDQRCPVGQFGVDCSEFCPDCQNGGSCDSRSGACVCTAGYEGPICDRTCTPGTWGDGCSYVCSQACNASCFPITGQCSCIPGTCLNGGTCSSQSVCVCRQGFSGSDCSLKTIHGSGAIVSTRTLTKSTSGISSSRLVTKTTATLSSHVITKINSSIQHRATSVSPSPSMSVSTVHTRDSGLQLQNQNDGSISLSKGQLAGVVLGLILLSLISTMAIFLLMRKKYTGKFIQKPYNNSSAFVSPDEDSSNSMGFSNPLHFSHSSTSKDDPERVKDGIKDSVA